MYNIKKINKIKDPYNIPYVKKISLIIIFFNLIKTFLFIIKKFIYLYKNSDYFYYLKRKINLLFKIILKPRKRL